MMNAISKITNPNTVGFHGDGRSVVGFHGHMRTVRLPRGSLGGSALEVITSP